MLVWSAYLLLELVYGSEDTFDHVKRRSLQQMDERKLYQELIKIYSSLDRHQVHAAAHMRTTHLEF